MAQCNRAAIDVDLVVRNVKGLHVTQNHGSKGFVQLKQIDIRDFHLGLLEKLFRHIDRASQHEGWFRTDIGKRTDTRTRLDIKGFASLLRANENACCTINNTRRVTGMVNMIDGFDFWMRLNANSIEAAHFTRHHEGWVQLAERLHISAWTHMLVMVENG